MIALSNRSRSFGPGLLAAALISTSISVLAPAPSQAASIMLNETGSTLLYPLFNQWIPDYAKVAPDVTLTAAGTGSADHLACVLFDVTVGIDVTHVPYRGGQPAMQDLIAGRIDYICNVLTTALPQIQGEVGATGTEGTWIGTGYLVSEIVMIPMTAWLTRVLGLRNLLLVRHTENAEGLKGLESLHVLSMANALERAGDHIKNMAEELCHLATGHTMRHLIRSKDKPIEQLFLDWLTRQSSPNEWPC